MDLPIEHDDLMGFYVTYPLVMTNRASHGSQMALIEIDGEIDGDYRSENSMGGYLTMTNWQCHNQMVYPMVTTSIMYIISDFQPPSNIIQLSQASKKIEESTPTSLFVADHGKLKLFIPFLSFFWVPISQFATFIQPGVWITSCRVAASTGLSRSSCVRCVRRKMSDVSW